MNRTHKKQLMGQNREPKSKQGIHRILAQKQKWHQTSVGKRYVTHAKTLQLCPTLWPSGPQPARLPCPWDSPGKEWVPMPSSRGSSWPKDWTHISYVSYNGRQVLYHLRHLGSPGQKMYFHQLKLGPMGKHIGIFITHMGFLWWLRWWRICLQCRRPGFDTWVGNMPWKRA